MEINLTLIITKMTENLQFSNKQVLLKNYVDVVMEWWTQPEIIIEKMTYSYVLEQWNNGTTWPAS